MKAAGTAESHKRFLDQGIELVASKTPEAFGQFLRDQVKTFARLAQDRDERESVISFRDGTSLPTFSDNRVHLTAEEAQTLAEETLFQRAGYDAEEARIIADHVVDAALVRLRILGTAEDIERRRATSN